MSLLATACSEPAISIERALFETMLTIEDGTIVSGADSYISTSDLTTYAARYGGNATGTEILKERAILNAMLYIESFEPKLYGSRVSGLQELAWPREQVPKQIVNVYYANNVVPSGIKNALSEAALIELANPGELIATIDAGAYGQVSVRQKVGPLETETRYSADGADAMKVYSRILYFMRPFLVSGSGGNRAVRGN